MAEDGAGLVLLEMDSPSMYTFLWVSHLACIVSANPVCNVCSTEKVSKNIELLST